MTQSKTMMVFVEQRGGAIQRVAYELLGEARRLLDRHDRDWTLKALVIGDAFDRTSLRTLIDHGADKVLCVESPSLKHYDTVNYTDAIERAVGECDPEALLIGGTMIGRDLAPRVSARLNTGLTADATHMDFEDEDSDILHVTRPAFGGNLYATIVCESHRPQMASIRPGVFEPEAPDTKRHGSIETLAAPRPRPSLVRTIETHKKETRERSIDEAQLIISAGRGVKGCLDLIRDVADKFDGDVGASRALVDDGLIGKSSQVGQTGTTVRPVIYLACGISGAIQHIAGMDKSETVIAINTDESAPIFNVADLGVVGDAKPILEALKNHTTTGNTP